MTVSIGQFSSFPLSTFRLNQFFRTPIGLEDVSKYPRLIEHLMLVDGWSDDEIIKLIGGNILRVLEANEQIAASLQDLPPTEELIPFEDLEKYNFTSCRYLDMYDQTNV